MSGQPERCPTCDSHSPNVKIWLKFGDPLSVCSDDTWHGDWTQLNGPFELALGELREVFDGDGDGDG